MNWLTRTLGSSVGRKMLVALTGLALVGFVITHMLGNLQVFAGREALNAYAANIKSLGPLLWAMRAGLLLAFVTHVGLALKLAAENRAARPERYAHNAHVQSTSGARSMVITGLMVLLFILYHLAHFTFGLTDPGSFNADEAIMTAAGPVNRHDVYYMVVTGFQQPLVTILYIAAMVCLALHMSHGVQSVFQSLGLNHPKHEPLIRKLAVGLAWVIFLGNAAMPVAVLAGLVDLPGA